MAYSCGPSWFGLHRTDLFCSSNLKCEVSVDLDAHFASFTRAEAARLKLSRPCTSRKEWERMTVFACERGVWENFPRYFFPNTLARAFLITASLDYIYR